MTETNNKPLAGVNSMTHEETIALHKKKISELEKRRDEDWERETRDIQQLQKAIQIVENMQATIEDKETDDA